MHWNVPPDALPGSTTLAGLWTELSMRRPHPLLCNCQDNEKLAFHYTACYKMEWIYTQTKVRGGGRETRKKKNFDKWIIFEHLVLACTIVLMNDLYLNR